MSKISWTTSKDSFADIFYGFILGEDELLSSFSLIFDTIGKNLEFFLLSNCFCSSSK